MLLLIAWLHNASGENGLGYTTFMTSVMIVLQAILPQHLLSRAIGKLAGLSKPVWLKNDAGACFYAPLRH